MDFFFFLFQTTETLKQAIKRFQEIVIKFLNKVPDENVGHFIIHFLNKPSLADPFFANSTLQLRRINPYANQNEGLVVLHNDLTKVTNGTENLQEYVNVLLAYTPQLSPRQLSIKENLFDSGAEPHFKAIGLRCLMKNYFSTECNETGDQVIINECLNLINELNNRSKTNKDLLLYNQ